MCARHPVTPPRARARAARQAKSLLAVKGSDTFLDFIAKQVAPCALQFARRLRRAQAQGAPCAMQGAPSRCAVRHAGCAMQVAA